MNGRIEQETLLVLDDSGEIVSIESNVKDIDSMAGVEYHNGMIVPGFVNCHSHLEYSYVKGMIPPGGGLPEFIRAIIEIKISAPVEESVMIDAASQWDAVMAAEGTVAIGDHNNNDYVYGVKEQSKIFYRTFVEMLDVEGETPDETFAVGMERVNKHHSLNLDATMVPHANYTMADRLIALSGGEATSDKGVKVDGIVSVHFKESIAMAGEGERETTINNISAERDNILLVHCIYASKEDIAYAKAKFGDKMTVVVCPMSNLYIENSIADIDMILEQGVRLTVGTDSLSSNTTLSMIEEVKTLIARGYSQEQVLGWATHNGAIALGIDSWAGDLAAGKRPGIVLIDNIDPTTGAITEASRSKRIA